MRAPGRRHHVQDSVPHLVALIEFQPAALGEHRLGNLEQYGPHTCRLAKLTPTFAKLTPASQGV